VEQLRASHESVAPRPRNPAVESAWTQYGKAFADWSSLSESRILSDHEGYAAAEAKRQQTLILLRERRDLALFEYFELYDADQREAFGG